MKQWQTGFRLDAFAVQLVNVALLQACHVKTSGLAVVADFNSIDRRSRVVDFRTAVSGLKNVGVGAEFV